MITGVFRRLTERFSPGDAYGERGVHWVINNSDGDPPFFRRMRPGKEGPSIT